MMFEGARTLVATMVMQPNPQKRSELDVCAARASRSCRRPAGPADFWVLEQHVPWPLCACAKMLLHVVGFSAIVSHAPPVSGAWHAP